MRTHGALTHNSLRTHGVITEPSRTDSLTTHIGKGREGKGKGNGTSALALTTHLQSVTRGFADAWSLRSEVIR